MFICVFIAGIAQASYGSSSLNGIQKAVRMSGAKATAKLADDPTKVSNILAAVKAGDALLVSKLLDDWPIDARFGDKKQTLAHVAVLNDKEQVLDVLVHRGANLNMIDLDGYTPLDIWHEQGKSNASISAILQRGKALDAAQVAKQKSFYHDLFTSRLAEVAEQGKRKLVERFLSLGADPMRAEMTINPKSQQDTQLPTTSKSRKLVHTLPIHLAIANGHADVAAIILNAMNASDKTLNKREIIYDAPLVWGLYYRSWTPVQWAIFAEDWPMVEELFRAGAGLNHQNSEHSGISEESLAYHDGSLLKHGGVGYHTARMDAYDTAALIGAEDKLLAAITAAEREELITMLIHKAATTSKTEVFDKLIAHGVELRAGEKFEIAKQFALARPNYGALEYLLRLRQQNNKVIPFEHVDTPAADGSQAELNDYVKAAELGDSRLLLLALRYGADPDGYRTALGETLLLRDFKLKHRYNRGKNANILLTAGADPNLADNEGKTALFHVIEQVQVWAEFPLMLKWVVTDVKELLHYEANPNVQTHTEQRTPLHVAVISAAAARGKGVEHVQDIIAALIKHGADPKIKDSQGHDAFHYAEQIEGQVNRDLMLGILMAANK